MNMSIMLAIGSVDFLPIHLDILIRKGYNHLKRMLIEHLNIHVSKNKNEIKKKDANHRPNMKAKKAKFCMIIQDKIFAALGQEKFLR